MNQGNASVCLTFIYYYCIINAQIGGVYYKDIVEVKFVWFL